MLDGLTLDQLRTFVAAAETGSFSAAGRRIGRAQSVVSQTLANLEAQAGVRLFDRSRRYPVLTDAGRALLVEASAVAGSVAAFKARAKGLSEGLEPELSVVVDVLFPIGDVTRAVAAFRDAFPQTPLRLSVEALGGAIKPVVDGTCAFGLAALPHLPPGFSGEPVLDVAMVLVAAPGHSLAAHRGVIPRRLLSKHVQLVLTDSTDLSSGREFGVMSPRTWRLADLGAKHAFLRAGLGWGGMPLDVVAEDFERGSLVRLRFENEPLGGVSLPMVAIWLAAAPPGPVGRWMIEHLKTMGRRHEG